MRSSGLLAALILVVASAAPLRADETIDKLERQAQADAAASGRTFKTHQDVINYELCKQGSSQFCSHIHYKDAPPQVTPTPAPTRGASSAPGTPPAPSGSDGSGASGSSGGDASGVAGGDAGSSGGGAGSSGSGASAGSAPVAASGAADQVAARGAAAMGRASAIGERMKAAPTDDGPPLPGGKAGSAGQAGAGAGAAGARGSGANAGGGFSDAASLAASGFGASFTQAGLKMGSGVTAGQVVRADGTPASPDDLARLRAQVAQDPAALMKRPDFFDVLDRPRFNRLKSDFVSKPEARDGAFKHVGMTEGARDFVRTQSCNPKLEKNCNELAKEPYKKGEFISPEDLKAIDDALHPEGADASASGPTGAAAEELPGAERRVLDTAATQSLSARLGALFGGALGRLTGGSASAGGVRGSGDPRTAGEAGGARATRDRAGEGSVGRRVQNAAAPSSARLRPWQSAVLAVLIAAWLYGRRRRRSFMER
jgi:hypothetical protein